MGFYKENIERTSPFSNQIKTYLYEDFGGVFLKTDAEKDLLGNSDIQMILKTPKYKVPNLSTEDITHISIRGNFFNDDITCRYGIYCNITWPTEYDKLRDGLGRIGMYYFVTNQKIRKVIYGDLDVFRRLLKEKVDIWEESTGLKFVKQNKRYGPHASWMFQNGQDGNLFLSFPLDFFPPEFFIGIREVEV